ncbi:MAG: phosphoribosylanthranilate isomerase [Acidobacteriia bacterium]|nr:phosphoribosylanthranilate isomerase [Terriglobia bacterium]
MAVSLGVDALGFLVGLSYRTDDELDLQSAQRIIAEVPPFVSSVLVTHQVDLGWVARACGQSGCNVVQLHGDFALAQIPQLRQMAPNVRIIKAVNIVDESAVTRAVAAAQQADAVLLDSRTATRIGGTGKTHDWTISARIVQAVEKPVILAGGLKPENVARAIKVVQPFAVDVNSGLEFPDGSKSPQKVEDFISLAKATAGAGTHGVPAG